MTVALGSAVGRQPFLPASTSARVRGRRSSPCGGWAEACDALDPLSAAGYPFVHEAVLAALRSWRWNCGSKAWAEIEDIPPLSWRPCSEAGGSATEDVRRYRALVRARNELRYLGLAPSGHPLGILRDRSARDGCRTIAAVLGDDRERKVAIAALPAATRRVETLRGPMRFVTWEDETGLLESRIAPAAHARLGGRFRPEGAFRVTGAMRFRGPVRRLEVEALVPLAPPASPPVSLRTASAAAPA